MLRSSIAGVVLALASSGSLLAQGRVVDLLIRGGTVIDGTGAAERRADVGITKDRIAFVGDATAAIRDAFYCNNFLDLMGSAAP